MFIGNEITTSVKQKWCETAFHCILLLVNDENQRIKPNLDQETVYKTVYAISPVAPCYL